MSLTPLPTPPGAISHKTLAKGELLFRQGDQTTAIFAVRRGRVRMLRHLADGAAVPLFVAQGGDTFSEAALFSPVYHCDAVADVETEVEVHPKDALMQALSENPDAAQTLMAHLARQVIGLRSRLEIRNIRSAEDRVMQFLQLEGTGGAGDGAITFPRPLKDIAADIGLTHEAFYRTLAKLEKSGRIVRDGRVIRLVRPG